MKCMHPVCARVSRIPIGLSAVAAFNLLQIVVHLTDGDETTPSLRKDSPIPILEIRYLTIFYSVISHVPKTHCC